MNELSHPNSCLTSYRDKELLPLLDIPGGDHTEDVTEPGVLTLHVDDVPLWAVVDQVAGGGLVVVPVLEPVWSTLIGRGSTRLGSHWLRAS